MVSGVLSGAEEKDMEYALSLSYGKDSLACLGAIEELGWPLDRIVHAEVWATDTIPADLPPMVEFKAKADAVIADGHTVHDFEKRFQAEDSGFISPDDKVFRWAMLDEELNYRWF